MQPRKKGNHALSLAESTVKNKDCCGGGTVLYGKRGGYVYLRSTKSICFFALARIARCYGFHGRQRRSSSCTPFRIGEGVPFSDVLHACVSCNPFVRREIAAAVWFAVSSVCSTALCCWRRSPRVTCKRFHGPPPPSMNPWVQLRVKRRRLVAAASER